MQSLEEAGFDLDTKEVPITTTSCDGGTQTEPGVMEEISLSQGEFVEREEFSMQAVLASNTMKRNCQTRLEDSLRGNQSTPSMRRGAVWEAIVADRVEHAKSQLHHHHIHGRHSLAVNDTVTKVASSSDKGGREVKEPGWVLQRLPLKEYESTREEPLRDESEVPAGNPWKGHGEPFGMEPACCLPVQACYPRAGPLGYGSPYYRLVNAPPFHSLTMPPRSLPPHQPN